MLMLRVMLKFSVAFLPLVAIGLCGWWLAAHYHGLIFAIGLMLAILGFGAAALASYILISGFARIHGAASDAFELSDRCAKEFERTGKMPNPDEVMQQMRKEKNSR